MGRWEWHASCVINSDVYAYNFLDHQHGTTVFRLALTEPMNESTTSGAVSALFITVLWVRLRNIETCPSIGWRAFNHSLVHAKSDPNQSDRTSPRPQQQPRSNRNFNMKAPLKKASFLLFSLSLCGWSIVLAFVPSGPSTEAAGAQRRWIEGGTRPPLPPPFFPEQYSTTSLYQSAASSSSSNSESNDDMAFMTALRSRMDETKKNRMPLVVLDSMLPRQELNITIRNPALLQLIQNRIANESPVFCMLGMARLATGEYVHLKYGVPVEIVQCQITPGKRVSVHLKADPHHLLRIMGDTVTSSPHGDWTEAQVEVLDPHEAERAENSLRLAHAMWKARKLEGLVQEWIPLAKTKERIIGQVDSIVQRLGVMPTAEQPSDRAFWVGALINPIPALGVAMEIRPALLLAKTPNERVDIVTAGIKQSIERLKQPPKSSPSPPSTPPPPPAAWR
jgi:hypothetical protein